MCGSAYYNIASKLAKWMSVIPEANINSSTSMMVNDIKSVKLDKDEILISYDVLSLYANVPVEEAIQDAATKLYSGEYDSPPID